MSEHARQPPAAAIILAHKRLTRNARIVRQTKALTSAGLRVIVVCLEKPAEPIENAVFIEDSVDTARERILRKAKLDPTYNWPRRVLPRTGLARVLLRISLYVNKDPAVRRSATRLAERRHVPLVAATAMFPFRFILKQFYFAPRVLELLDGHPDLFDGRVVMVQSHDATPLRAAHKVAAKFSDRARGRPIVVYDAVEWTADRSGETFRERPAFVRALETWLDDRYARRADKLIVAVPAHKRLYQSRYRRDDVVVVRNCAEYVPPDEIARSRTAIRQDVGARPADVLTVFPGARYLGLGAPLVVNALAQLDERFKLVFVGFPAARATEEALKHLISELGLASRVYLRGPQLPHRVVPHIAGGDVGVIAFTRGSTNRESAAPNRLYDMVMARLPPVMPNFPSFSGFAERYGVGRLFEPGNAASLAAAIRELADPANRCEQELRLESAAKELRWERERVGYLEQVMSE